MQQRTLGRTGFQVGELGLGTEYLIGAPHERIVSVVREAIANGITYFDLFCAEAGFRDAMGEAFAGHRDGVILAAHLGAGINDEGQYQKTRSLRKAERFFDDFLIRYNTDYADVLFLHNCDSQKDVDTILGERGLLSLALRLKEAGQVRAIGFSGHTVSTSLQAVKSDHVDVLMFPVNIAGNAEPGKQDLLKTCAARGVGVVAMKPYGGGKLLRKDRMIRMGRFHRGGEATKLRKNAPITPVRCLAYALSQVGVCTVVPGCSNLEHLSDALAYCRAGEAERGFADILADFNQYVEGECVYCNHCLPCPAGIDIGQTIRLLEMAQQGMTDAIRDTYSAMPASAADCTQCGACEQRCPFGVSTMEKMAQAAALFG